MSEAIDLSGLELTMDERRALDRLSDHERAMLRFFNRRELVTALRMLASQLAPPLPTSREVTEEDLATLFADREEG